MPGARDLPQRRLRELAAMVFKHAPALEGGQKPRRDLRVLRIERQHDAGDELIAAAVAGIETRLIAGGEGADQRAHAVRIAEREGGMVHEACGSASSVSPARDHRLQREPFVDDQSLARVAAVEGLEARRRARRPGVCASAPRAAISSVMVSAVSNCRAASRPPPDGIAGAVKIERGIAQGAPPGRRGIRRIGAVLGHAAHRRRAARARGLCRSRAQRLARGVDRVGIDVLADLARDVGFARQGDHLRGEGRIGVAASSMTVAERVDEACVGSGRAAGADAATERSSSRVA